MEMVRQYESTLYKVEKRILDNSEDVADAMQDTIISAYENIHNLKLDGKFTAIIGGRAMARRWGKQC